MYSACYGPAKEIMQECYNEVRSGNEIRSVVMQGARLNDINTGKIDGTFTWKASLDSVPCRRSRATCSTPQIACAESDGLCAWGALAGARCHRQVGEPGAFAPEEELARLSSDMQSCARPMCDGSSATLDATPYSMLSGRFLSARPHPHNSPVPCCCAC